MTRRRRWTGWLTAGLACLGLVLTAPVLAQQAGNQADSRIATAWQIPIEAASRFPALSFGSGREPHISFEATPGMAVRSPAAGQLLHAGRLSPVEVGFVIQHAGGLISVLSASNEWAWTAGLKGGANVAAGERLATVNERASVLRGNAVVWSLYRDESGELGGKLSVGSAAVASGLAGREGADQAVALLRAAPSVNVKELVRMGAFHILSGESNALRDASVRVDGAEFRYLELLANAFLAEPGRYTLEITSGRFLKSTVREQIVVEAGAFTEVNADTRNGAVAVRSTAPVQVGGIKLAAVPVATAAPIAPVASATPIAAPQAMPPVTNPVIAAPAPASAPAPAAAPVATPIVAMAQPTPVAALPPNPRRKALVVGNDTYEHVPRLDNAATDAQAIADALAQAGFRVTLERNLSERGMKQALRDFRMSVQGGDEVVVFFAGHGVQIGNTNYLLPTDIRGVNEEQVKDEAIQLQRVLDDMQDRRAGFMLAIIDACRDNPFKVAGRSIGTRGLAPTSAATGQMIIFSAGTGQQALDKLGPDDTSKNGLFTRLFVREMNRPGVPVDRMLRSVRSEVARLARSVGHEQTPALYDQALGDFFFRPN